jgi:hypothetical protein
MEPGVRPRKVFEVIRARLDDRGHEIDVRCFAAEAVVLRSHEAAEASQLDLTRQARVEFSQEGPVGAKLQCDDIWFRSLELPWFRPGR